MSGRRLGGDEVFCHQCQHRWDRQDGGIVCPRCQSEFTEILEAGSRRVGFEDEHNQMPPSPGSPRYPEPAPFPSLLSGFLPNMFTNNQPSPNRGNDGGAHFATWQFNTGGPGGARVQFTSSRTSGPFSPGGVGTRSGFDAQPPLGFGAVPSPFAPFPGVDAGSPGSNHPMHGQMQPGNIQDLFSLMLGAMQQPVQPQNLNQGYRATTPFDILHHFLAPAGAAHGDMVFTNEDMDRVMTQLMQNTGQTGAPPASAEAMANLPTKKVDAGMLGSEGKAECSICMDSVEQGIEVTVLPCSHWFHGECVKAWLGEHDTCPHCRKSIGNPTPPRPGPAQPQPSMSYSTRPESSRRRSSRAHRRNSGGDRQGDRDGDRDGERDRDGRRRSSRQQERDQEHGGITGWFRDRLPF